jgi:hypothetical protein
MIDIVQYRASIGSFAGVSLKKTQLMRDVDGLCLGDLYNEYEHWPHLFMNYVKHYLLQYLGIYDTISQSVIKLKLLLLSNDVEENPGPQFTKIISGSFHQGDVEKFLESAGLQCAINCIISTCFSLVKKISVWNPNDLDYILETGDKYFKSHGYVQYLALDELPLIVDIAGLYFQPE